MGLWNRLKQSFVSGMIAIIPLLITLVIVKFLAGWAFMIIDPIVRSTDLTSYTGNIEIVAQLIAGAFVVISLTTIGYISNYKLGKRVRGNILKIVNDIPLFGTVYKTVNQISESFTGGNSRFKEVVLIEFPREGIYSMGLVTNESPDAMEESVDKDLETVFIPMSPNPTMGNLIMVERDEYTKLDMKVSKGMKLLLTTGIAFEDDELPAEISDRKLDQ